MNLAILLVVRRALTSWFAARVRLMLAKYESPLRLDNF